MLSRARYQIGVTASDYGDPLRLGCEMRVVLQGRSPSIRRRQAPSRSWLAGLAAAILLAARSQVPKRCIVQTRWRFCAAVMVGGLSAILAVMSGVFESVVRHPERLGLGGYHVAK
jgi:hypothetical protein